MVGKIVDIKGVLYVEYTTVGNELDEVDAKIIKLSTQDLHKVNTGDSVVFEVKSFYGIGDEEVAIIKNK